MPKYLRLVVVGGNSVGKTAVIEQAVFGKHSPGQVGATCNTLTLTLNTQARMDLACSTKYNKDKF